MSFSDFHGNDEVVHPLREMLARDRFPHGVILSGPAGSGKYTLATMDWNQTLIPVGKGDEGFDVSPDGRELWTANSQDGTLSVIDLARKEVTATIDAKILASNRLKFTPDGRLVFITSLRGSDVVVYDGVSRRELKRVQLGHGAAGILMDPVGGRAFVACTPDNYLAVINLKTLEVVGHIDVGVQPDGLAWSVRQ